MGIGRIREQQAGFDGGDRRAPRATGRWRGSEKAGSFLSMKQYGQIKDRVLADLSVVPVRGRRCVRSARPQR